MSCTPSILNVNRASTTLVANGAGTVLFNNQPLALMGTVAANGAVVVTARDTVLAENRGVATAGDMMSDGSAIL
jgi:uncharacterized Zn-binding protein involved in type VI secretion